MEKQIKTLNENINYLKIMLDNLLLYKKPTDKIVVACSQQLDEFIVQYQKTKLTHNQIA